MKRYIVKVYAEGSIYYVDRFSDWTEFAEHVTIFDTQTAAEAVAKMLCKCDALKAVRGVAEAVPVWVHFEDFEVLSDDETVH